MALCGGLPLGGLQKAVLLVCSSLLIFQVYLSFTEYQRHEYVQIQEDSTLSKVTLPMVIICHNKGFNESVMGNFATGMTPEGHFFGWSKNNMTTKTYMESLTNQNKGQLIHKIYFSEQFSGSGKPIKTEKNRITYPDGQCYTMNIPKQKKNSTEPLNNIFLILRLKETQHPKIYLHDPNTFNGYFNLAEELDFDQSTYHVKDYMCL